jgi:hypothetical protein
MSDKDNFKLLNGKSLHLYHHPAKTRRGKMIRVEFNYDNQGGIRFEDGTTSTESLYQVVRRINDDFELDKDSRGLHQSETTKYAFKVDPAFHSEIGGKKNLTINDYIRGGYVNMD